jgi:hypothetical protein
LVATADESFEFGAQLGPVPFVRRQPSLLADKMFQCVLLIVLQVRPVCVHRFYGICDVN